MTLEEAIRKLAAIGLLAEGEEKEKGPVLRGGFAVIGTLPTESRVINIYSSSFEVYRKDANSEWVCEVQLGTQRITRSFPTFDKAVERVYQWHIAPSRPFNYENTMSLEEGAAILQNIGFTIVPRYPDNLYAHDNEPFGINPVYDVQSQRHSVHVSVKGMVYVAYIINHHNNSWDNGYSTVIVCKTAREAIEAVAKHYIEHPITFGPKLS